MKIANNTLNRRIKVTPAEAVKSLRLGEEVKRQQKPLKKPETIKKRALKVGTKVRALLEKRGKVKAGFKTYKGNHFGPVQTVTRVMWFQGYPKYELDKVKTSADGNLTKWRKDLSSVKKETRRAVGAAKKKLEKKVAAIEAKIERGKRGAVSKYAWHDELIRASAADKISRDMVAGRAIQYDHAPKKKKAWKDPKVAKHSVRFKQGTKVVWRGKKATIVSGRGTARTKQWQIKVGGETKWVKPGTLTSAAHFVDLT